MTDQNDARSRRNVPIWALTVIAIAAAAIGFLLAMIIGNIGVAKGQSASQYTQVVELKQDTYDPAVWGQNFPAQYKGWQDTAIYKTSDHKPNALIPWNAKTDDDIESNDIKDTRTAVTSSKIQEDDRVKRLWKGFAFAMDYRHARGHMYMLEDQMMTLRVLDKDQPGACIHCHASTVQMWTEVGDAGEGASFNEKMQAGFEALNAIPYDCEAAGVPATREAKGDDTYCADIEQDMESIVKAHSVDQVNGDPIGCIDCHDPATMKLRISRPGLINGMAALKEGQGITGYDVNKDATNQELRALVCAQCHIEYYFGGPNKDVIFPWGEGSVDIDATYDYYQTERFTSFGADGKAGTEKQVFSDYWTPDAKVGMLKVQHPEYEVWSSSIHAANGVTCADCHMAYKRDGAQKVSNHDVQNPLTDINASCGTCHAASEQILQDRVRTINNRFKTSRDAGLDSEMVLLEMLTAVQAEDSTLSVKPETLAAVKALYRKAGYYIDYAYSENSYGFHNPDYMQRVIAQSIDASRQGQVMLAAEGVPVPDLGPSAKTLENREHIESSGLK
ncbi:MAG: ammonia-forming cytochrome c nitrite reductase subunit c552 [Propionibacteriaceae bacterium]|nr:ammonia-forming cytochrome c nitrite reductase subunit c552 [Propionibacteriaceae bacterium]